MGEYDDLIAHVNGAKSAGEYDDLIKAAGPSPAPTPQEEPANPVASLARRVLGIDPRSRFSLGNLGKSLGNEGGEPIFPAASPDGRAPVPTDKLERDAGPMANDWGAQAIIGTLMSGAAGKVAGPLLGRAGKVAPVLQGGLEGGLGTKVQGGDALGGGAMGAGLGSLGPLGKAVMNSHGGQARQFIEKRGGTVDIASPGRGGPFNDMDVNGTSDAHIGKQAAVSAEKGLGMLSDQRAAELRPTGKLYDQINESPAGLKQRDVSNLVPTLEDAAASFGTSASAEGDLRRVLDKVKAHQKPGFNADVDPYMLSEADLNLAKRDLDRAAKTGVSTDEKLSPLKRAADDTRAMVDQGPYKPVNDMYGEASNKYRESRRLLGISERPKTPGESQQAVEKVTNLITRRKQNTVTAGKGEGGTQSNLGAFEAKHPDIGLELSKPALLRNKADISAHILPQEHGGLIDRGSSAISTAGIANAVASIFGHGAGHIGPSIAAGLTGLTLKNMPAIEARLMYPFAEQVADGQAAKLNPLFAAARASKERPSMNEALRSLNVAGPNRKEDRP